MTTSLAQPHAIRLAWTRGLLQYKLYPHQRVLYRDLWAAIENPLCLKFYLNCARRFGKTTIMLLVAISFAIRRPNSQIRFAAPTQKALKKILNPIFKWAIHDCPRDLRPRYFSQDQMWWFPNGSEIHIAGTDNGHYENLRGTTSHLNLMDEVGFMDELDYVMRSVLMPQTLTTGGTTLLASTPPKTPAHDAYTIATECERDGWYRCYDIYANKSLDTTTIEKFGKESGGINSSTFKREYLCQFVVDRELQIVPEWDYRYVAVTPPDEFRQYYHNYVSMDLGVKDFTAVLFAYYDFRRSMLVVNDELTMEGVAMTTDLLKEGIQEKERTTFGALPVYRRIADNNNLLLLQDLGAMHQMYFNPTNKDSLDAMVNEVRMFVNDGRLMIDPRCTMLIGCLKYGIWDNQHKAFGRATVYRHFDHLAALVYLIRNLDQHTNPIPSLHAMSPHTHHIQQQGKAHHALDRLFGFRKH
jgi:hypothetical protein